MEKCEHLKKYWIVQTLGGLSLVGGDFWDDSREIVICINCGKVITKMAEKQAEKQARKLIGETSHIN